MLTIFTVDALAGAGKTYGACTWSIEQARQDRKIALVQPSIDLIHETLKTLRQSGCHDVRLTEITSRTHPFNVAKAIMDRLKTTPQDVGEILIITHAAFVGLPYWHRRGDWTLIIDEVIAAVSDLSLTIPEEHKRLTENVILQPFNATYSRMRPTEGRKWLTQVARNPRRDQVWNLFNEPAKRLLDDNWSVYAQLSNYHRILEDDGAPDAHKLIMFGQLHSSIVRGFAKVIVMGAMLKESLLYALWSAEGVTFKPHAIQAKLRYQQHTNGSLITVEYLLDRPWSKNLRDKALPDGTGTVWESVVKRSLNAMGNDPYIYLVNNDVEGEMADSFDGGTAVSTVCHGLNTYSGIHKAVFLSALNPAPAHLKFVDTLGFNADELRRSMYLQSVYQAMMRTSIRNPHDTTPKHIVVMDRDAAEYLQLHFPGCTLKRAANMPELCVKKGGQKKVYRDAKARANAAKARERVRREVTKLGHPKAAKSVSIVPSIYTREVISHEITCNQALMDELRSALDYEVGDKYTNILISPAKFCVKSGTSVRRGLENIESVDGIWLDNDGGDLASHDFRKLFPYLWFAAYSTHSNGGRYRLFIPTKQCMSVEADGMIKHMIMQVINHAGYKSKKVKDDDRVHGFDMGKLTASSIFFIPCKRPGDNAAFFTEYPGTELDPVLWLTNPTISSLFDPESEPAPAVLVTPIDTSCDQLTRVRAQLTQDSAIVLNKDARINHAKANYLAVPTGMKQRHSAFFKLGVMLLYLGCSLTEISEHLLSVAQDKKRRDQIKSVLSSIRKQANWTTTDRQAA